MLLMPSASEASHSLAELATARYQRSGCESRAVESGGHVDSTTPTHRSHIHRMEVPPRLTLYSGDGEELEHYG